MTVKAKFRCASIVDTAYNPEYKNRMVNFNAVYGKEGENADYANATPYGELKLQIDQSTPAHDAFVPGKEYYLTIEEA